MGFALSYDSPPSGGEREPSPTKHPPPTTHPPTNPPPRQYNSSGAVRTDQSTTPAQHVLRQDARSWVLGGICTFLRFSTFRGRAPAVPWRGFSWPPLAELGLFGRCVAVATEGLCVGRAWHGRAVARGRVASGRAESCKCTVFRVGLIAPISCEASHVILVTHIPRENDRQRRRIHHRRKRSLQCRRI